MRRFFPLSAVPVCRKRQVQALRYGDAVSNRAKYQILLQLGQDFFMSHSPILGLYFLNLRHKPTNFLHD